MRIFHLAFANLKRGKSAVVSLFILILMAALLLNIGLTILAQLSSFYDHKVDELHDPHVSIIMNSDLFQSANIDFLNEHPEVIETEMEDVLLMNSAQFLYGDSDLNIRVVLYNADTDRSFSPLMLIEKLDTIQQDDIYLPYIFKTNSGYKLGDPFILTNLDQDHSFRVAGFFEATMMGSQNMGIMKFYLTDAGYRDVSAELGEQAKGIAMSALLTDRTRSPYLLDEYNEHFQTSHSGDYSQSMWEVDIDTVKMAGTITISIVAMIFVAFAVVMVLVSLLVIKFRVTNTIEDGLVNIGVLKAMGYKSKEVLASIVLQFLLITVSACIVGVALSYVVMPIFGGLVSTLAGLIWMQTFDVVINLVSMFVVIALVLIVTFFSTLRVRKLPPVEALRGGIQTHSFRRNIFPLEKTKGGLHLLLALKTMIAFKKQNIMIALIMAAITFASVFAVVLFYNIAIDKKAFVHLVGVETSNVMMLVKQDVDSKALQANIEEMEGVTKVTLLDTIKTNIDGHSTYTNVSDDFSRLENNTIFEGRHPIYDNEISISWLVSQQLQKGVGDTLDVQVEDTSYSYLITGLSQSINNMGQVVDITIAGIQRLIPEYEGNVFNVYLKGIDNERLIQTFKSQYGHQVDEVLDVDKNLESQTGVYVSAVFAVMIVIILTTVLVVIMILYLVIKTMILKRKQELGILKALGYTTLQLMNQIAISFVPVVIVGVLIGCILGYVYTNPMLSILLSSSGVHNAHFVVNLPLTILLGFGIVVLAYIVALLVSRRIKIITPYSLITE